MESKKADDNPKDEKCMIRFARCMMPLFKDKLIVTSSKCTIYCNFMLFVVLAVLGVIIKATANNSIEFRIRYDDKCQTTANCPFNFTIRQAVSGPVYLYIHYTNFYISHRNVMNSQSKSQLAGNDLPTSTTTTTCSGMLNNEDLKKNLGMTTSLPWYLGGGTTLPDSDGLNPCGIYPSLFPTDTFAISMLDNNNNVIKNIPLDASNINYKGLAGSKFKVSDSTKSKLWTNVEDPRFIEWMKPPMNSDFYKLWGVINDGFQPGNYQVIINNGKLKLTERCETFELDQDPKGGVHDEPELAWRKQSVDVLRLLHGCTVLAFHWRRIDVRREA